MTFKLFCYIYWHAGINKDGNAEFADFYEEITNQEEAYEGKDDDSCDDDDDDEDQENEDAMVTGLDPPSNNLGKHILSHQFT